ncbi:MAG TPA: hypothetical protein VL500_07505 [Candidatus Eisenbacteria bacterium]|nr:hypothetical protein [Candidatus Eisenbacteria bacterium]
MKRLPLFFVLAVLAAGCATAPPPLYAFDYAPPQRESWHRSYAQGRETSSLQCVFDDDRTDAQVKIYRDPFHSPSPADALRAYRVVMSRRGFEIPDGSLAVAKDGTARFPIADPAHRLKGEVIGIRVPSDRKSVVLIGTWPEENDVAARSGMRLLASNLFIRAME